MYKYRFIYTVHRYILYSTCYTFMCIYTYIHMYTCMCANTYMDVRNYINVIRIAYMSYVYMYILHIYMCVV